MKARPKRMLTAFRKEHCSWTGFMFFTLGTWHPVKEFIGGSANIAESLCGLSSVKMTYLISEKTACPECMDVLVKIYGGELQNARARVQQTERKIKS